jgi:hypothetical protein
MKPKTAVESLIYAQGLIDKLSERVAELERLYAEQCRENITLQGRNDKLRAGLEKVRGLRDSARACKGDTWPGSAIDRALTTALQIAGVDHG